MSIATELIKTHIVIHLSQSSLVDLTFNTKATNPTVSTITSTQYAMLPTQCDGQARITAVAKHTEVKTTMVSGDDYITLLSRQSVSLPFTAFNTGFNLPVFQPVPRLECQIPPTECSTQWDLFLKFVRSTRPDVGDFNGLYKMFKPVFDSYPPFDRVFFMKDGYMWPGLALAQSGLLTGSPFLDEVMHRAHRFGLGMKTFFGGCPQAQKMAIQDCQNGLEKTGKKFSAQLADLSVEEATDRVIENIGCSLQAAHAMVIHFADEQALGTKRDICANNGWGEDSASSITTTEGPLKTAIMSAITFPSHYNPGE
jgi:hypothetical protein